MGALQYARGDVGRAETAFKNAIAVNPKSIDARLALAQFYWASGKLKGAEESFKAASTIDPASLLGNGPGATFYLWQGRSAATEAPLPPALHVSADQPEHPLLPTNF